VIFIEARDLVLVVGVEEVDVVPGDEGDLLLEYGVITSLTLPNCGSAGARFFT